MDNVRAVLIGGLVTLVIIGGLIYTQLDNWFETEPQGPGSGDELPYEEEPQGPGSGDELPYEGEEGEGPGSGEINEVIGSCNHISFGSTCVDYVGSFWITIKDPISACSGTGTWSDEPCAANYRGGCNMNGGSDKEMTIWHYDYGGDPFGPPAIQAVATGCTTSPFGLWVLGN